MSRRAVTRAHGVGAPGRAPGDRGVLVVAEQLRRSVPGGIGTAGRGLLQGLATLGEGEVPAVTLYASRAPSVPDPLAATGYPVVTSRLPAVALTRAWDRGVLGVPAGFGVVHTLSLALPPTRGVPLVATVHDVAWRHHPEAIRPGAGAGTKRPCNAPCAARRTSWSPPTPWPPIWWRRAPPPTPCLWCRSAATIFPTPTTTPPPPCSAAWGWRASSSWRWGRSNRGRTWPGCSTPTRRPGPLGAGVPPGGGGPDRLGGRRGGRAPGWCWPGPWAVPRSPPSTAGRACSSTCRSRRASACPRSRPCARVRPWWRARCRAPVGRRSRSIPPTSTPWRRGSWRPPPTTPPAPACGRRARRAAASLTWRATATAVVSLWRSLS